MGGAQASISERFKNTSKNTFIFKKRYKVEKVE